MAENHATTASMRFIRLDTKGECIVCHRPTFHVTTSATRCHPACYQRPENGSSTEVAR